MKHLKTFNEGIKDLKDTTNELLDIRDVFLDLDEVHDVNISYFDKGEPGDVPKWSSSESSKFTSIKIEIDKRWKSQTSDYYTKEECEDIIDNNIKRVLELSPTVNMVVYVNNGGHDRLDLIKASTKDFFNNHLVYKFEIRAWFYY